MTKKKKKPTTNKSVYHRKKKGLNRCKIKITQYAPGSSGKIRILWIAVFFFIRKCLLLIFLSLIKTNQ